MPPAVMLEKVAALRKAAQSDEGEAAVSKGFSFRRPAGRSASILSGKTVAISISAPPSCFVTKQQYADKQLTEHIDGVLGRSQSMLQLGTGRLVLADQAQQEARDIEPCEGMLEVTKTLTLALSEQCLGGHGLACKAT